MIIRRLKSTEHELYKSIRLKALKQDPYAFAAKYDEAVLRDNESWINQTIDLSESQDSCAFIAVENDEIIGLCVIYKEKENEKIGELVQVWIDPKYRGSGLASDLIKEIYAWGKNVGICIIKAVVHFDNPRALRFYEIIGYEEVKRDGRDVILKKRI